MSSIRSIATRMRRRNERPRVRLFCFHHAGGSARSFAAWRFMLPPGIEVVPVELPKAWRTPGTGATWPLAALMQALVPALHASLGRDQPNAPFAFYGHSLGALIAFELTRELRRRGGSQPIALCVSGRRAPRCPPRGAALSDLAEDELIEGLRRMGGTDAPLLAKPKWRAAFLPTIREDLRLSDRYAYDAESPITIPFFGFRGSSDPTVTETEFAAWTDETAGPRTLRELSGAHFFDAAGTAALHRYLAEDLTTLLARCGSWTAQAIDVGSHLACERSARDAAK